MKGAKCAITLSPAFDEEAEAEGWFENQGLVMVAIITESGRCIGVGVPPETAVKDLLARATEAANKASVLLEAAELEQRKARAS